LPQPDFFNIPAFPLSEQWRKPLYFQASQTFPSLHSSIHKMLWLAIGYVPPLDGISGFKLNVSDVAAATEPEVTRPVLPRKIERRIRVLDRQER
jgi:hypothetical protein